MGDRKAAELWTYFSQLEVALRSVAALCDDTTTIIQVVAFAEPAWQLPRYLDVARAAGMIELTPPARDDAPDGRLCASARTGAGMPISAAKFRPATRRCCSSGGRPI